MGDRSSAGPMSAATAYLQLERAVLDTYHLPTLAEDMTHRRRAREAVDAVLNELRAHPDWLEELKLVPPPPAEAQPFGYPPPPYPPCGFKKHPAGCRCSVNVTSNEPQPGVVEP